MSKVRHLRRAGVGIEEVEEVGVVCCKAVAEVDRFHWIQERVGCVMVVEIARTSLVEDVRIRRVW